MAQSSLDRLQRVRDVRVRWLSYELRPERPLTPDEEKAMRAYRMKVDQNWPHVQAMAASYGLAFGARNRNTRSRLALEGAKFAEAHGRADEYAHAMFHAHFVAGRDISDPDTLTELARQAGLDGDAMPRQQRHLRRAAGKPFERHKPMNRGELPDGVHARVEIHWRDALASLADFGNAQPDLVPHVYERIGSHGASPVKSRVSHID